MIVYHGSVCEVSQPNLKFSKNRLDFGRAFYVTSYRRQAEKWALRKAIRTRGKPIVSVYRMADSTNGLRIKDFYEANGAWLDFVCASRSGKRPSPTFDVIRGRVADDDVFKTIDAYLKGDITRAAALKELRYAKPNDQLAFATMKGIRTLLQFKRSYQVKRD